MFAGEGVVFLPMHGVLCLYCGVLLPGGRQRIRLSGWHEQRCHGQYQQLRLRPLCSGELLLDDEFFRLHAMSSRHLFDSHWRNSLRSMSFRENF